MFLAVLRIPDVDDADARAAAATGLDRVDAKRRLVGTLPRVLLVAADRDEVEAAAARLGRAGFAALVFEPLSSPTDEDRIVPRALEVESDALVVVAGVGAETRHVVPFGAIELIQRGVRHRARSEKVTTTSRQLALGRTILAGGMPMTRKVEKTETVTRAEDEPFALLHRKDGGDDVILYERRLDYSFLGAERQSISRSNLDRTVAVVAARSQAALDDRLARPHFVSGIPACAADPADVAAHLCHLAWRLTSGAQAKANAKANANADADEG